MELIDTHTHIYLPELQADIDGILTRAKANGISKFYLPNIDVTSMPYVFELARNNPDSCFPMIGLHPCSVMEDVAMELPKIMEVAKQEKIWAIGEIGIDLYWNKNLIAEQKWAFQQQIKLAKELSLPIVIHCRDAFEEVYEVLLAENDELLKGIFHCFGGTLIQANKIIELGLYLGIGGVLTYKNAGLAEVIKEVDMKHLVLETDSPYLSPVPHRGKQNESSFLIYVAEKLAEIKNCSLEEVAEITSRNAKVVFAE